MTMILSWFSCGVTSAIATKLILSESRDVRIIYIDTQSEHPDSKRFLKDCENWFNHPIEIYTTSKYSGHFDVIEKKKFINSPTGAPCTLELKKKVRWWIEDSIGKWDAQVIGYDISEKKRADRFKLQYPYAKPIFPLIEHQLTKNDCLSLIQRAKIEIPIMYRLGFHNNNCIGCVKGGKGYWWHIKRYFPDIFERMAKIERSLKHSCIKGCYLDELRPTSLPPLVESCSLFCDPDFMDL